MKKASSSRKNPEKPRPEPKADQKKRAGAPAPERISNTDRLLERGAKMGF